MNGRSFSKAVDLIFSRFLSDLGFNEIEKTISGNFYSVRHSSSQYEISISFEPDTENVLIVLYSLVKDDISDIDNHLISPRLSDLNLRYMHLVTDAQRAENDDYFKELNSHDPIEKRLIKSAKELRLVLPKYFSNS
jgi:hypothetical protein